MTLMVGLNMKRFSFREICYKWGFNEAFDDSGKGFGKGYYCTEKALRIKAGVKPQREGRGGKYLIWFDSERTDCFIEEETLKKELNRLFPGDDLRAGSLMSESVTTTLHKLFLEKFGIRYSLH